jgi:acetyl esterase/lipase
MTTRHLVDAELAPHLDDFPALDITAEILPALRQDFAAGPPLHAPATADVDRQEVWIPGRDGAPPVRALVYRPARAPAEARLGAVLHVHGGGFIVGTPEWSDLRNRYTAGDIGCVVVSVDYRLAPETPFPGPIEDCYTALLWLHANADLLGVDERRIAVRGESAGGGLAAALALMARDRKQVALAFQLLTYPMLDDRTGSTADENANAHTGEFVWTRGSNRFGWSAMLGREPGGADVSPYCAPARAADLAGLPPTFVQVGSLDLFLDEDVEYAHRLLRAGVNTELHVYPGVFHGFDMVPGRVEAAFARDAHEALRHAIAG